MIKIPCSAPRGLDPRRVHLNDQEFEELCIPCRLVWRIKLATQACYTAG